MPGLLKQLQKPNIRSGESVSDVLITEEGLDSDSDFNPELLKEGKLEAEQLLDDLLKEADALHQGLPRQARPKSTSSSVGESDSEGSRLLTSSGVRVVRRKRSSGASSTQKLKLDNSLPRWSFEQKTLSQDGAAILAAAESALLDSRMFRDHPELTTDERIEMALSMAKEALPVTSSADRHEANEAEKELRLLLVGQGPLKVLYDDEAVTDIIIEAHNRVKVIRHGLVIESPFHFRSATEYRLFIDAILIADQRELSVANPIVSCVVGDEYQCYLNLVHESIVDGEEPRTCIRIPRTQPISFYDILQTKTLPATVASWLAEVIATRRANLLVVGPLGSGKTVMTSCLLSAVGSAERIIAIEDIPEILFSSAHMEKLLTRPANARGEGAVTKSDLLRAALSRSPHRIVLGEIMEEEGQLFLRALENGYSGSVATLAADSAVDGLWRFLDIVAAFDRTPQRSLLRRISRSIQLVACMQRVNGTPCLVELVEVKRPTEDEFAVLPIVSYRGVVDGRRIWERTDEESHWIKFLEDEQGVSLNIGSGLVAADESVVSSD